MRGFRPFRRLVRRLVPARVTQGSIVLSSVAYAESVRGKASKDQAMATALTWIGNFTVFLGSVALIVATFSNVGERKYW
jgi:hypothetical protein